MVGGVRGGTVVGDDAREMMGRRGDFLGDGAQYPRATQRAYRELIVERA